MSSELLQGQVKLILDDIKTALKGEWDSLPEAHKESAARAAKRLVQLKAKELRGEDVSVQRQFVQTTVEGFKLAGQIKLYNAFNEVMESALKRVGGILADIAKDSIPGL